MMWKLKSSSHVESINRKESMLNLELAIGNSSPHHLYIKSLKPQHNNYCIIYTMEYF